MAFSCEEVELITKKPEFKRIARIFDNLNDRPIVGGLASQTCVLENGGRFYVNRIAPRWNQADVFNKGNLLSKPMSELLKEAERVQVQLMANREKMKRELQQRSDTGDLSLLSVAKEKGLWVDKYTPNAFSQLLSPEPINREVLFELKQWDKFVFKKEVPKHLPPSTNKYGGNKHTLPNTPGGGQASVGNFGGEHVEEMASNVGASDEQNGGPVDERPKCKVILLSGPPGTGKTTLAHVIARHCGYRPFEVNASDDRSTEVLRDAVIRAMSSNTITGDRRPNCIILDEIDGIDGRAPIEMLVALLKAPLPLRTEKGAFGTGKQGKRAGGTDSSISGSGGAKKGVNSGLALTRPLICICNDHHAPALRDLKALSKVVLFQPPTELRLVQRLKTICANEKLQVSRITFSRSPANGVYVSTTTKKYILMYVHTLTLPLMTCVGGGSLTVGAVSGCRPRY